MGYAARTLRVLELAAAGPVGTREVAAELGVDLRTARGLLRRLADDGALAATAGRRTTFAAGPRLEALAAAVLGAPGAPGR
jgi:DNA-binding IclR family transcriptional regulator